MCEREREREIECACVCESAYSPYRAPFTATRSNWHHAAAEAAAEAEAEANSGSGTCSEGVPLDNCMQHGVAVHQMRHMSHMRHGTA